MKKIILLFLILFIANISYWDNLHNYYKNFSLEERKEYNSFSDSLEKEISNIDDINWLETRIKLVHDKLSEIKKQSYYMFNNKNLLIAVLLRLNEILYERLNILKWINIEEEYDFKIKYKDQEVDTIIYDPKKENVNIILLFHWTVIDDTNIYDATNIILQKLKKILNRDDFMIISVSHPQEKWLLWDNLKYAKTALLWTKNNASEELWVNINKIFMIWHSQWWYLASILNTMYEIDWVIVNAPWPINIKYRCELEEKWKMENWKVCTDLYNEFGNTKNNPNEYIKRSLISSIKQKFKSDILLIQWLKDKKIQLNMWPYLKKRIIDVNNKNRYKFLEIDNAEHWALFETKIWIKWLNDFLESKIKN